MYTPNIRDINFADLVVLSVSSTQCSLMVMENKEGSFSPLALEYL